MAPEVRNQGLIVAERGLVILSARATAELRASVIKNSGHESLLKCQP